MTNKLTTTIIFSLAVCAPFASVARAQTTEPKVEWNRFRGPNGSGIHLTSKAPLEWDDNKNIQWKCPLPGPGSSSPIVTGNRVFLTAHSATPIDGKRFEKYLLCIELSSGKVLWKQSIPRSNAEPEDSSDLLRKTNSGFAPHTPVTDGQHVFAYFGVDGMFAFDFDGNQRWHVPSGNSRQQFGSGASPILYKNLAVINTGVENGEILAINKTSGLIEWRFEDELLRKSFTTPVVTQRNGKDELIVNLCGKLVAIRADDGTLIWSHTYEGANMFQCSSPAPYEQTTYFWTNSRLGLVAAKPGTSQDVLDQAQWTLRRRGFVTSSPAIHDGEIVSVNESTVHIVNPQNGELFDELKLQTYSRRFYASPVRIRDHWLVLGLDGVGVLWPAGLKLSDPSNQTINLLEEENAHFAATPTVTNDEILIRSNRFLYCISASSNGTNVKEDAIKLAELVEQRERAEALLGSGKFSEAIEVCVNTLARVKVSKDVSIEEHGNILYIAGMSFLQSGKLESAIISFKENLEVLNKADSPLSAKKSNVLFELSQIYIQNEGYAQARLACERCLEVLREASEQPFENHGLYTVAVLESLTRVNDAEGNLKEAKETQNQSLAMAEDIFGVESQRFRSSLLRNMDYALAKRPADAIPLGERWLKSLDKLGQSDSIEAARCHQKLSVANGLSTAGSLSEKSIAHSKAATGILLKHPDAPKHEIAFNAGVLGKSLQKLGRIGEARTYLKIAVDASRQTDGADEIRLGLLTAYAQVCESIYDYERALPVFVEAVEFSKKQNGPESAEYGITLAKYADSLAGSFVAGGNVENASQAIDNFFDALNVLEKSLGKEHAESVHVHHRLGTHLWNCQMLKEAEKHLTIAIEAAESNPKIGKDEANSCRDSLAAVYELSGEHAKALENYRAAFKSVQDRDLSDSSFTSVLHNLSASELQNGNVSNAIKQQRKVRRGIHQFVQKLLPGLAEEDQLRYLGELYWARLNIAITFITHKAIANSNTPEAKNIESDTAEWLINGKAMSAEALARRQQRLALIDNPSASELRRVFREKASIASADSKTSTDAERLVGELENLERNLSLKLLDELVSESKPWTEVSAIRRQLKPSEVLIEFARFRNRNHDFKTGQKVRYFPARYGAWIVPPNDKGEVEFVDLGSAEEINSAIGRLSKILSNPDQISAAIKTSGEGTATQFWRTEAEQTRTLIWDKISSRMPQDTDSLIFSPDSTLWKLPWAAIPIANDKFLAEEYSIQLVVSGRDLVAGDKSVPSQQSLLFADPDFDLAVDENEQRSAKLFKNKDFSQTSGLRSGIDLASVGRLPYTKTEADSVAPSLERLCGKSAKIYSGKLALESILKANPSPEYLVLSTHGFFLTDEQKRPEAGTTSQRKKGKVTNPLLRCGVLLAGCNTKQFAAGEDGVLTGLEVVNLDLRGTKMVILSACNTGTGQITNGEGVAGLRQAFQLAGAQSVVSSLWQVEDGETARLMKSLLENLADGKSKPEALRQAQLSRIKARRARHGAAHPFFWAAFTLTGQD